MSIRYEFEVKPEHGDINPIADGIDWLRMPLPFALIGNLLLLSLAIILFSFWRASPKRPWPVTQMEFLVHLLADAVRRADNVVMVQRLDRFVNANGRRLFNRVQPGHAVVRAQWGSRRGSKEIQLIDGEAKTIHIVVK